MLALILGLVSASVPLQQCNNVTSCFLQVNGTRPLIKLIGSLPNGGVGHTFTTADCMLGLIAIDENCQCQNATLYGSSYNPSFCYSSGDWAKTQDITIYVSFCKNQNGLNTFSLLNSTFYTRCKCFDPASGSEETATIDRPVCKKGKSSYKPCASTDGTGDNAAVLAKYTGATLKPSWTYREINGLGVRQKLSQSVRAGLKTADLRQRLIWKARKIIDTARPILVTARDSKFAQKACSSPRTRLLTKNAHADSVLAMPARNANLK